MPKIPKNQLIFKITKSNLKLGSVGIRGHNLKHFSGGERTTKIEAIFENEDRLISLTYSPKNALIYGLTAWYQAHQAPAGDIIKLEVLEPKKKYKFTFQRQLHKEPFLLRSPKKDRRATFVGEPINFRGMVYAPVNEQGVVLLFGKIHDEIGIKIEALRTGYPDVTIRRFNGRAWVSERAEFEYRSSDFIQHGHDPDKADIIACWTHDWPDCPLEVIELKAIIQHCPASHQTKICP
jgi:hypothetical protein